MGTLLVLLILLIPVALVLAVVLLRRRRRPAPPMKTGPGPESTLRQCPLLYLYFDQFDELVAAVKERRMRVAVNVYDPRSASYSLSDLLGDEAAFLRLYKESLLRLRLSDGKVLCRKEEQEYWDRLKHPERYADEQQELVDPVLNEFYQRIRAKMNREVAALRARYGS